jgi:hypothetical protein
MKKTYEKPALAKAGALGKLAAFADCPFSDIEKCDPSDIRLKTNISRIGTTVFGLPHYRFSYLGSNEMFTGVMAQDVIDVMPEAVIRDATGFYRVNYGMLGIEMQRAA